MSNLLDARVARCSPGRASFLFMAPRTAGEASLPLERRRDEAGSHTANRANSNVRASVTRV